MTVGARTLAQRFARAGIPRAPRRPRRGAVRFDGVKREWGAALRTEIEGILGVAGMPRTGLMEDRDSRASLHPRAQPTDIETLPGDAIWPYPHVDAEQIPSIQQLAPFL